MSNIVKRSEKIPFYGVVEDGNVIYKRMTGFTEISVSKNPIEHKRQYVDEPFERNDVVGYTTGERLDNFIHDLVSTSFGKDDIMMSDEVGTAMKKLREFMFERVYFSEGKKKEEYKVDLMIKYLFDWYVKNPKDLPDLYKQLLKDYSLETVVADYISTMTDTYALDTFKILFEPCYNITSIY